MVYACLRNVFPKLQFYDWGHQILGLHRSVIKTKNRNHSMNKVKNLGYDRWLISKQPRQESGLWALFFIHALFAEVCHQNL